LQWDQTEPGIRVIGYAVTAAALLLCPDVSHADQGGGSFWFPGQFASLVAVQQTPGWALGVIYYHSSVAAAGSAAAAREILTGRIPATVNVDLNLSLSGRADLVALAPSYTFATPVLGGQLVVGMSGQYGRTAASITGTLTAIAGPIVVTRSGMLEGSLTSYGDLAPFAELLWNHGVNNYMAYVTGNIPVGDYDPTRIPNIGLGHGAIDVGGAYTYFDPATGKRNLGRRRLTYNLGIPTRSTGAASISTSTGAHRTTSPSSFSSALPDTPTSKSPTIPARTRSSVASGHAFSVSVRKSDTASRSETCRAP
jgi:Protein involved in meta-pathway of phenol degradation